MGGRVPKAFLLLGGRPLYLHSLETFLALREVREVVVVVPKGMKLPGTVQGGRRRQDSVLKGLRATDPSSDLVLVHDAARPFVTPGLIRRVIRAAARAGAAVPGMPVGDTIKLVGRGSRVRRTLDRSELCAVQTPQGFRRAALVSAYAAGHGRRDATDDAQVVERAGGIVAVVNGIPENFKITSRSDLIRAEDYFQYWRRPRTPRGPSRSARGAGP